MKRNLFMLVTFLSFSFACAQENEFSFDNFQPSDEYQQITADEYLQVNSDVNEEEDQLLMQEVNVASGLEEYEQHVCDHVKPPKPSSISAILTNIGCTLLIHYVSLTEKAKIYLAAIKQTLAKWLCDNA